MKAENRLLRGQGGFIVPQMLARMTGLSTAYLVSTEQAESEHVVRELQSVGTKASSSNAATFVSDKQEREQELVAVAHRLADLLCVPEVAEGILTCNWNILDTLLHWLPRMKQRPKPNSHDRSNLVTLALYLQRLSTKCDTNGAYGPVFWGQLNTNIPQALSLIHEDSTFGIGKRESNVVYWVADALFQHVALSALPLAKRIPRRHPMSHLKNGCLTRVDVLANISTEPVHLDEREVQIFNLCDGETTIEDIARCTALATEDVVKVANTLAEKGWIFLGPEIPLGLANPLKWVQDWVERNLNEQDAQDALSILHKMDTYRQLYQDSPSQSRKSIVADATAFVADVIGGAGTRGAGQFYADRYALSEDASRNWKQLDLGKPIVDVLQHEMLPLLRGLMSVPTARWNARHALLAEWFTRRFGETSIPLTDFCQAAEQDATYIDQLFATAEQTAQAIATELFQVLLEAGASDNGEVIVNQEKVADFARKYPAVPCAVQPDIMVLMTEASPRVVLGDLHATHDLLIHGTYTRMHPQPESLIQDVWAGYGSVFHEHPCIPIMEHTDQTITSLPLPTYNIEILGRSRENEQRRIAAGELTVVRHGNRLLLHAPSIGPICFTRIPVWYPASRTSVLSLFAQPTIDRLEDDVLPEDFGQSNVPRLLFGNIVVLRKTWVVNATEFMPEQGAETFTQQIAAWRRRERVPSRFFVRLPFEKKPVFIDVANPFLMEWLRKRLANREVLVQFTEVYPDFPDLWLKDEKGPYCIEFRLSTFLGDDRDSIEYAEVNRLPRNV